MRTVENYIVHSVPSLLFCDLYMSLTYLYLCISDLFGSGNTKVFTVSRRR